MPRVISHCPKCKAKLVKAISYTEAESQFWLRCPRCPTFVNTYIPQPHQMTVHEDDHTYIGNFGAYGTGKTLTSMEEAYKHLFLTPNANMLIGANVTHQYEQTIKRDIEMDLPKDFIKGYSAQKSYYDMVNGARIMFRPFDDPDKLRSLNLTFFVMVEASEVKSEAFTQLKTRLRNTAATRAHLTDRIELENGDSIPKIQYDWRKGIIESNPDSGWIRTDVLLNSSAITKHGNVMDEQQVLPEAADSAMSSHIASTDVNKFLPPTFIEELVKNKPAWWVARYIYSSFNYAEGLVYPSALKSLVNPFPIPKGWKRIIACDYGLSDNFVLLFGAIDEKAGILYIYDIGVTKDKSVEDLAKMYHSMTAGIPSGAIFGQPIMDPKSGAKRDYNKKTLYDHFLDYGISFKAGHVNLDARIFRLNTYLESGKLKIFNTLHYLIEELREYKFPEKTLGATRANPDKPVDRNNHAVNPLEWICMELPSDPKDLLYGVYNSKGLDITSIQPQDRVLPFALTDDSTTSFQGGAPWNPF